MIQYKTAPCGCVLPARDVEVMELLLHGDQHYQAQDWSRAIELYQQATELDWYHSQSAPQLAEAVYRRAFHSHDADDRDSAIATCRKVLKNNPDCLEAMWYLARALDDAGMLADEVYGLVIDVCTTCTLKFVAIIPALDEPHFSDAIDAMDSQMKWFMAFLTAKLEGEPYVWPELPPLPGSLAEAEEPDER